MRKFWAHVASVGFLAVALSAPVALHAEEAAAPAVLLDPGQGVKDNLERLASAKRGVEVTLHGGKAYRGRIGGVGDQAVLLTEIEGREFYDAWIALDEIAAIEVRVRGNR